jgi:hypothetical protein
MVVAQNRVLLSNVTVASLEWMALQALPLLYSARAGQSSYEGTMIIPSKSKRNVQFYLRESCT